MSFSVKTLTRYSCLPYLLSLVADAWEFIASAVSRCLSGRLPRGAGDGGEVSGCSGVGQTGSFQSNSGQVHRLHCVQIRLHVGARFPGRLLFVCKSQGQQWSSITVSTQTKSESLRWMAEVPAGREGSHRKHHG